MAKVIKNDKLIVNTKWDVYKHVLTGLKQSLENNSGHKYDTIYLSFGNIESIILEQATNKAIVTVLQSKSTWYRDEVRSLSTKLKEMSKTNFENCEKIWKKNCIRTVAVVKNFTDRLDKKGRPLDHYL